jgi:hypothetical protein
VTPKSYFDDVWARADLFGALHAYITNNAAAALDPAELLRAEWAMRVSALDLYVHELVSQRLLEIFQGARPPCPGYLKIQVSNDTLMRIHANGKGNASDAAFDLEVRTRLSRVTFQAPDEIADGIRMVSSIELWNEIAKHYGAAGAAIKTDAGDLKAELAQIVNRRHKIVHEGDLQPSTPRVPWAITRLDVDHVKTVVLRIVNGIEAVA